MSPKRSEAHKLITQASVIFLDFDGVIKDSASVKSQAYTTLFISFFQTLDQSFVAAVTQKTIKDMGGASRYNLIPEIYKRLCGKVVDERLLNVLLCEYGEIAESAVLRSDYIEGAKSFLQLFSKRALLFLITNTPQSEIERILVKLKIDKYFVAVNGAPLSKSGAISALIDLHRESKKNCIFIGDMPNDKSAANKVGLNFIWRTNSDCLVDPYIKTFKDIC